MHRRWVSVVALVGEVAVFAAAAAVLALGAMTLR